MSDLAEIFIKALLIDNVVLMRFLALCPFIGMSTDIKKSVGMGGAVTFVTVLATAVTWPLFKFVLVPFHLEFLQILTFILVIASLVQLVEFYLKKSAPALYSSMGVYLALITTNCAILAVTFDSISNDYTFIQSLVYAVGVAVGFMLSMLLLAGIRERIKIAKIPAFLKGTPILFMSAALLSMAFGGFAGLIK
ncbi:MAG TPA: RnfABCDGE type electron transport complex subunit A [Treponemataceae bacterium]|jgi:electron transport complex protein RnfA|nr:MAG: Electron transport complex protein RnfA [Spirochaetes bacterium ADurb.Bin269]TAH55722.1 MAG: RnfABCDGE type electron transport complex subunit A [Treponema sp.]HOC28248.1 RnfABCDGE type electron transport complex subunit A [Treponemataceae bacterium]HPX47502.1 RnfABCDGE type electron transport complex subunit A [Treponemataceae bacterium]HQL32404.1 RnfABCDGE type electron transport complex subunit A [Treponemataceae bacterium]